MRRAVFFSLFLFGVLTVASGFLSLASEVAWASRLHAVVGSLFVLLIIGHVYRSFRRPRRAS
jgi:cytochrome b561